MPILILRTGAPPGRPEHHRKSPIEIALPRITEGQYALGGLTVLAVWLFVILPLLHYFGASNVTVWVTLASTIVTAIAGGVVALFTIVLARVGNQQIADTKILQRAYLSVEPLASRQASPAI